MTVTAAQITRRAGADGVGARTVERDYVIHHVLAALARRDDPRLVFKGGTALRLCFFDAFRYSADLDFSVVDGPVQHGRRWSGHHPRPC